MLNIFNSCQKIKSLYTPKIIAEVNNQYIKLVKINGNKVPWHNHKNEDELFFIIEGSLLMEIENKPSFKMQKGDLFVVTKGLNHKVSSQKECTIMLIESKSTLHTGNVISKITKSIESQKK